MSDTLQAETEVLDLIEQLRASNRRMHRRCQLAEAALPEWQKISAATKGQTTGRFYPALIRLALTLAEEEVQRLKLWMSHARHHDNCQVIYGPELCSCGRLELLAGERAAETSNVERRTSNIERRRRIPRQHQGDHRPPLQPGGSDQ